MPKQSDNLIFVELNEINMQIAKRYADAGLLPNFSRLQKLKSLETTSEKKYEELEPWVQWVSVHTGLPAKEHGVFRLGDMVNSQAPQYLEQLESQGWKVGAVSPMNTVNRLKNPGYFLPDPWTQTSTDGSFWSEQLTAVLQQTVNDNAQSKVTVKSLVLLLLGLVRFARIRNYWRYAKLALTSPGRPWRKALFLDLFLHDLHMKLFQAKRPDFSSLFLNAGAHIQHHYFLNSTEVENKSLRNPQWYVDESYDPLKEMLQFYDVVIGEYLDKPGINLIVATGLSQVPYDRIKYYWRLKNHAEFLNQLGIRFKSVAPRMTRDFQIDFDSEDDCLLASKQLHAITELESGEPLFKEIDVRGNNLFVSLTWPEDITESTKLNFEGQEHLLKPHVAFVAIKNGMHSAKGYAYFSEGVANYAPENGQHVKGLYNSVLAFFKDRQPALDQTG